MAEVTVRSGGCIDGRYDGVGDASGAHDAVARDAADRTNGTAPRDVAEAGGAAREPVVKVGGFSFAYELEDGAFRTVLSDMSLEVECGAFCVIVGPTGCGKTTLLRSLKPELAPVGKRAGSIEVAGISLLRDGNSVPERAGGMDRRTSASQVGFVMQDPDMQIVCDTVWHELAFGLENLGVPQDQMRRRVAEVAHFFGIEPWVRQSTESLSGGQKQIVNLAAVLALRPRLLLLDEPTAQLDPNALRRFLFLLARVNRELGITVVMATHAPEDVADYATQVVTVGEVGALGKRADLAGELEARWTERSAVLMHADVALEARGACFRYKREEEWVLRGLDMRVARGSVHVVAGGNGSGKSTLLKLLADVLKPQRGSVCNQLASVQALMPQDPKALFVCDTVVEELAEWQSRCGYGEAEIRVALERFDLAEHAAQHPYDLSGGQRQKLAMAKLLLTDPQLLFLDEPTKGLDPTSCADVVRLLRALADEGRTVVLVTHDLDFAFAVADDVSMVFDGELACTEPARAFFDNNLVYCPNAESRLFGELLR